MDELGLTLRIENQQRRRGGHNWFTIDVYDGDGTSYLGKCVGHFSDLPAGATITDTTHCWKLEYKSSAHSWSFHAPKNNFSWD